MRHEPRRDNRGILDPVRLRRQVRFRRRLAAPALRQWVEHYWLIDWDLTESFEQRVVPHPTVNVVFQAQEGAAEHGEIAGVDTGLFTVTLHGTGRVSGVQFRPGGFRPFWRRPVAELTGRRVPITEGRSAPAPTTSAAPGWTSCLPRGRRLLTHSTRRPPRWSRRSAPTGPCCG
ncbi:DUF6597 domain-containing transcriptional factor [Micromonospora sp. BRA006-A]|nr:DUF6597 domain-containing transcriptional factor [Micromonospora sp. BRA006-A]